MIDTQLKRDGRSHGIQICDLIDVLGIGTREFLARSKQQEFAILEHYIRLHPDRFIEPETKKYGDKCVLYEWRRLR